MSSHLSVNRMFKPRPQMKNKMTAEEYQKLLANPIKKHKFNAKIKEVDGIKFSSTLEAAYYAQLMLKKKIGLVKYFLRQVPLHLPGKIKYVIDFLIFWADGHVEYIDVKGKDTPLSLTKRKQVEDLYPIKIKLVHEV